MNTPLELDLDQAVREARRLRSAYAQDALVRAVVGADLAIRRVAYGLRALVRRAAAQQHFLPR